MYNLLIYAFFPSKNSIIQNSFILYPHIFRLLRILDTITAVIRLTYPIENRSIFLAASRTVLNVFPLLRVTQGLDARATPSPYT